MVKGISAFTLLVLALMLTTASANPISAPATGNRVKINFGATPWKFNRGDANGAQTIAFNDAAWASVGLPHTWNDNDIFVNMAGGGPAPNMGGLAWYRKHFTLDQKYSNRKIFVEFEASHIGMQVYINGNLIKGNSKENPNATHVVGFIPVIVDITPYVTFGATENVLAVRIGDGGSFFSTPTFAYDFRFGQGCYGLWRQVWMHITDKVYIPANVYSVVNNWGTNVATTAASDASATVRVLTHVQNESGTKQSVTLVTRIVDAANAVVATQSTTQAIDSGASFVFDQTHTVTNPHLWYPAASPYGTPYMYKVLHFVNIGGTTVDAFKTPLGIRVITWDANGLPLINGHQHFLWGVGSRYDYPALATAVPEEQQWRDAKIAADYGARLWRPGHSTGSPQLTAACDAYGIMLMQPSGELEGNFATAQLTAGPNPNYKRNLKSECERDMVIRDRNNPSILAWEVSNGPIDPTYERYVRDSVEKFWEPIVPHLMSDREGVSTVAEIWSCSSRGCASGMHNGNPTSKAWGAEEWDYNTRFYRWDYDNEMNLANTFVQNWYQYKQAKVFGFAHWYFSETPGETGLGRGFQESMFDHNRIPKLLAKVYRANWVPYAFKPVVHLANHWNRAGSVTVNAFSNCPKVRLLINGQQQGNPVVPNAGGGGLMPSQCQWNVTWASGTLKAEGLDANDKVVCADSLVTAGNPASVKLTVEPPLVRPDGRAFQIQANGSDCAFILATVVDAQGNWCPTASNNITFAVTGPATYRGGADGDVKAGAYTVHSPGDPELSAQGGMCKIAVKSQFQTGTVNVTATSAGLGQGTASYTIAPAQIEVPIFDNVIARSVPSLHEGVPECQIEANSRGVRYFISQPAKLSVEVLTANGRIVAKIPASLQSAGWHPVPLADIRGSGVYFVRVAMNGKYTAAQRLITVR
jgi:beta-galactosidase